MHELMASDISKLKVINMLKQILFENQVKGVQEQIESFIKLLPGYGGFQIYRKTYVDEMADDVKIYLVTEDSEMFFEAERLHTRFRQVNADIGIIEHFLAMFLNKCPSSDQFFEIFPRNHIEMNMDKRQLRQFEMALDGCIQFRQNLRPTRPHQYEIFLNDHDDQIALVKKYFIDLILLK